MLSEKERDGCKKLLSKLSTAELISLADTVTKRQINVSGKTEAVKAILTYTNTAVELMRRRKMKRDILFQYLADCGVVVPVAADKRELMQSILSHWGAPVADLSEMDVDISEESLTATPTRSTATVSGAAQTTGGHYSPAGTQTDTQTVSQTDTQTDNHVTQNGRPIFIPQDSMLQPINSNFSANQQHNSLSNAIPNQNIDHLDSSVKSDSTTQTLGEQFAKWYYEMLNSFNPTTPDTPKDFGPHHFWDDAKLKVNAVTPSPAQEEYVGPQTVAERLISFTKEEQLLFNPNIGSEGVFVKTSRHGMVMIMVCGTIHRGNECLGVFQQVFGIIKDPRFNDNWKIKVTYLDVKSSQVTEMPKLEGNVDNVVNALIPI